MAVSGRSGSHLNLVAAVSVVLVLVPAVQLAVRLWIPSDQLPILESSGSMTEQGLRVAPPDPVNGILDGDVIRAIDGRRPADLYANPSARPVASGDRVSLTVVRGSETYPATVTVGGRREVGGLLSEIWPLLVASLIVLGPGVWLVRRRRDNAVAHALVLLASAMMSVTLASLANLEPLDLHARPGMVAWSILGRAGFLELPIALLMFAFAFPTGTGAGRALSRIRRASLLPITLVLVVAMAYLLGLWSLDADLVVDNVVGAVWVAGALTAVGVLATRVWRLRHDAIARRQGQIVVVGLVASLAPWIVLNVVPNEVPGAWFALVFLPFPMAVAVAASTHNLFDLDLILNRGLVAALTAGGLLVVYAGAVVATTAVFGGSDPIVAVPAACAVAVLFAGVRDRSQRWVGQRLFGFSSEPAVVFDRLGQRLSNAADPDALLSAVVETVSESLRLPYVAIEVNVGGVPRVVEQRGQPGDRVDCVELVGDGHAVGRLLISPRRGEASLSTQDAALLATLGRHAAVAAQVSQLTNTLRDARHHLAVEREAVRDRVQRDLHDRIGPVLVGLKLQLSAIAEDGGPGAQSDRLLRLDAQLTDALEDVRRLARDLRPAELEDIGLFAAIEAAANRLSTADGFRFDVHVPLVLPRLTRECEDAAYIVVLEAMTNAVRHSGGRRGVIRIAGGADHTLQGQVDDDGIGIEHTAGMGTGLRSMRSRVVAAGGEFEVSSSPSGGARVWFQLPVESPA